jgi:ABC-type lipoprotein release transport system permease subunit
MSSISGIDNSLHFLLVFGVVALLITCSLISGFTKENSTRARMRGTHF